MPAYVSMFAMSFFLFSWLVYAAVGLFVESMFTAASKVRRQLKQGRPVDWHLYGETQIWSIFVYGLSAAIGFHPAVLNFLGVLNWSWPLRGLFYTFAIFTFEFFWGWIIDCLIGFCPWDYRPSRTAIKGYIELKYAPFWFVFGFILERIAQLLN